MAIKVLGSYGKSGVAVIKPSKKNPHRFLVKFLDDEDDTTLSVFKESPYITDPDKVNGTYYIALNASNTEIRVIKPAGDIVYGRFVGFSRDLETDEIIVRHVEERTGVKNGKKWKIEAHEEFYCIFELPDLGITTVQSFPLPFVNADGVLGVRGFGTKKVLALLEACGVDVEKVTIPYDEDYLDRLEEVMIKASANVMVKLSFDEKGYLKDISKKEKFSTVELEEEEEQEEVPVRRKVKEIVEDEPRNNPRQAMKELGYEEEEETGEIKKVASSKVAKRLRSLLGEDEEEL